MQSSPLINISAPFWRSFWIVAIAITLFRILILALSSSELGPDEAQYWFWSRDFAFGYFSKPPMIAWAIGLTTNIFGHEEWAVRLSAPLFHLGTASFIYLTARQIFDKQIAFWAGLGWLTIPGVILSSFVIATDAPLLFFWSGGLFILFRIIQAEAPTPLNFATLGAAIGLGLLSKYAMIYFCIALAGVVIFAPTARSKLLRIPALLTPVIALALFAPNVIWNLQNDFQTLSHTAANANWSHSLFKPLSLLEFLGGQFVVFGVITFSALVYLVIRALRNSANRNETTLILLIFTLTPLAVVASQAFISRAHANWAAVAYPSAVLLVTWFLFSIRHARWAKISVAIHACMLILFSAGVVNLNLANKLGLASAVKDLRGWKEQTAYIVEQGDGYDAIVVDDRYLISEMLYHQKDAATEIVALDPNAHIDNHFEAFVPFDPERHKRVLFVTTRDDDAHVNYRFNKIKHIGKVETDLSERSYTLFALEGYFGPGTTQP